MGGTSRGGRQKVRTRGQLPLQRNGRRRSGSSVPIVWKSAGLELRVTEMLGRGGGSPRSSDGKRGRPARQAAGRTCREAGSKSRRDAWQISVDLKAAAASWAGEPGWRSMKVGRARVAGRTRCGTTGKAGGLLSGRRPGCGRKQVDPERGRTKWKELLAGPIPRSSAEPGEGNVLPGWGQKVGGQKE